MKQSSGIPPEWRAARRILAVRLDNLGDVLLTSPALRAIKESLPEAALTLLASPAGAPVARLNPFVERVIEYRAPWVDPWQRLPFDPARERAAIEELAAAAFDAAVIFTSFRQSPLPAAYLCYLAGIPLRLAATFDGAGSLLSTRLKRPESLSHEVERGLDLVAAVGLAPGADDLVLSVPPAAYAVAEPLVASLRARGGPLVVIHPGCTMPARTYPWEQFAATADLLVRELGAAIVLTGAADEAPLVEQIRARMRGPSWSVAGRFEIAALAALVKQADLVVTNNTGPMHIAAAVKTPVVALFALTNPPEQWGPWRVSHRLLYHEVPCRICYSRVCPTDHACLREVTPARVLNEVRGLLAEPRHTHTSKEVIGEHMV